jgi:putative oxidoreductase
VFRLLFSMIFVVAGMGHFFQRDTMLARLEAAPLGHLALLFGPPEKLMIASGFVLVVAGLALAAGFWTRAAAIALFLTLIPITVTTHLGDPDHVGPLFKNVALLGGLLHFAVRGPGAGALDERIVRRRSGATTSGS